MDFSAVCRMCLGADSLIPIFAKNVDHDYHERHVSSIFITTGIKVQINDSLPQQMCRDCFAFVNKSLTFRRQCKESEVKLLQYRPGSHEIDQTDKKVFHDNKLLEEKIDLKVELKCEYDFENTTIKTENDIDMEEPDSPTYMSGDNEESQASSLIEETTEESVKVEVNEKSENKKSKVQSVSEQMDEEDTVISTSEETSQAVSEKSLPHKSRHIYEKSYEKFTAWRLEHKHATCSENVMLAYFQYRIEKFKPSSLWVEYSMLKATLNIYHKTDIAQYTKLIALLKKKSEGFEMKKSKTFTTDQLKKFIEYAPDDVYLLKKVAVIFGITGACRRHELHDLTINNVIDNQNTLMVHIMNSKNQIDRTFTITGRHYDICKKYLNLRPKCKTPNFFIRYHRGKCVAQNIGINMFGQMGKMVASYLNLPNPELYTGHCFRRTSEVMLVDTGLDLKRHGFKSAAVDSFLDLGSKNVSNSSAQGNSSKSIQDQASPILATQTCSPGTYTTSQAIERNSSIHIDNAISANIPTMTITNNNIQSLHLHFHK